MQVKRTKQIECSKEAVKRFLVLKQGFLLHNGAKGTLEALRKLECVQMDPISVIHPNHHLVLHNRVLDYKTYYLEELLYKDRSIFEYWCNEKSLIPIEDFPYFRYRMENPSQFHSPFYERIKAQRKEMQKEISHVLSEIKKHGPLSARELEQKRKIKGKIATKVLNLLWDCGNLTIHHVDGNRRYYDLTENLLPSKINKTVPSRKEYEHFIIQKYMKAYGLIDNRDWRFGWLPLKNVERRAIVDEMIEKDKLCPIKIEGAKHEYYVLKEYLSILEKSDTPKNASILFLAPLDNLLWNRKMISEVFSFNYAWEVYKIPEKRIFGYYVMPILYGTDFIGRLDPKLDRQNKTMIIRSIILEKKEFEKNFVRELAATMHRFLRFHDISQISIEKAYPQTLKSALISELNKI